MGLCGTSDRLILVRISLGFAMVLQSLRSSVGSYYSSCGSSGRALSLLAFRWIFHCVSQAGSQLKNAHMAYTHNTHVAPCWTGCVFLQVVGCFGYTRLIYGIFSSIYNGAQQANVMSLVFRVARSTHTQRYQYFLCVHGRSNMTFAGCINLLTDDYFTYHLQSSLIKGLPPALHGLASSFST